MTTTQKRKLRRIMTSRGVMRLMLVLTVIAALTGFFVGNQDGLRGGQIASSAYEMCLRDRPQDWPGCQATFKADWKTLTQDHWLNAGVGALSFVVLLWLIWLGALVTVRVSAWIKDGFSDPPI